MTFTNIYANVLNSKRLIPRCIGAPMKLAVNLLAVALIGIGIVTLIGIGIEVLSSNKVEKPGSYVYASAIRTADELCKKSGGILRIGSIRSTEGVQYHLECFSGQEITFEHKLVR